jgi:hypothetical protein
MTDERVALGNAIFALHDPHPGHEVAFNRFYERDHMFAAIFAPFTMWAQRWVATAALKDLRYPADGPFGMPSVRGSYLTMYWIQAGHLDDQQLWTAGFTKLLDDHGRTFQERDVMSATTYEFVGDVARDDDGVPPELTLAHQYPGAVWTFIERDPETSLDEVRDWMLGEHLPLVLADAPVASTLAFTPMPKAAWWPAAAPEVPGVGDRLVLVHFLETAPTECWDPYFARLGAGIDASGKAQTLLVAPFVPTVPGTDRYCDELW